MPTRRRLLLITGCASALLWLAVTWLTHGIGGRPGFHYETRNDDMPTIAWLALHFLAGGLMVATFIALRRRERETVSRTAAASTAPIILGFAVVFRLILLPSVPIHESDFHRYLWDGASSAAGINPYEFEPGALTLHARGMTSPFADPQVPGVIWRGREFSNEEIDRLRILAELEHRHAPLLDRVGHPAVPTIYPPVAQGVFWLSVTLFGPSLLGLKAVLLGFELGILALIMALLRRFRRPVSGLLIYAWNPLVLKEIANSAHYDVVPVFFTLLALWLAVRPATGKAATPGARSLVAVIALAIGSLAKFFPALLLPLLVRPHWRQWRAFLTFGALTVAAFLPFALWDGLGWRRVFAGLGVYNAHWEYNAFIFGIVQRLLVLFAEPQVARTVGRLCCAMLLVALVAWLASHGRSRQPGPWRMTQYCSLTLGALFLLSPTAFPWYFCWVLPLLCLRPRWSWILLSLLLPLNYLDFHSATSLPLAHQQWLGVPVLTWIIWGPFVISWLVDRHPRRASRGEL